ncbi:DUF1269 domain-containing protein [Patescibacteria group bacterium]|nr:DUF1269 domain-containing protein [Patescibacteria group bacterium]
MSNILLGLFKDNKSAGMAVSELKEKGYTKEISLLAHDPKYEDPDIHEVKQDITTGTATGATVGAVAGALAALFSGITAVGIPGVGLIVGGPLAVALGLVGGAAGTLAGGLVGALVDLGINEATAQLYEERIRQGEVLIGVTTTEGTEENVRRVFTAHGAEEITTVREE